MNCWCKGTDEHILHEQRHLHKVLYCDDTTKSMFFNIAIYNHFTKGGCKHCIIYHIEQGFDVNQESNFSPLTSPLIHAVEHNNEEILKFLIHWGADVNKILSRTQITALDESCCMGVSQCTEILLKHGADLSIGTPFASAICAAHMYDHENIEIVKLLLHSKYAKMMFLDTKIKHKWCMDIKFQYPIVCAFRDECYLLLEFLLEMGADLWHLKNALLNELKTVAVQEKQIYLSRNCQPKSLFDICSWVIVKTYSNTVLLPSSIKKILW
jgi:hypothetical protein